MHLVLGVKEDLKGLGAVELVADALADNLSGVYDVLEDGLLHGGEGPGSWAGSLLCGTSVGSLGEDGALADDDDVTATERKEGRN